MSKQSIETVKAIHNAKRTGSYEQQTEVIAALIQQYAEDYHKERVEREVMDGIKDFLAWQVGDKEYDDEIIRMYQQFKKENP